MGKLTPAVLTVGLPQDIEKLISDILKNATVSSIPMEMDALIAEVSPRPCLVISGPPKPDLPATEIAQALRMQFQDIPILLCCDQKADFERKTFIKNGFTDAFLLPMDITNLRSSISEKLAEASKGEIRVYRPVKIIDLEPGTSLDFETNIFLPANNRYIKLSAAGDALENERIEKIKKSKFSTIQVPADQMKHFYSYSAKRLRDLGASAVSVTEKREKLSGAVRDLISGLFSEQTASFESGQSIMKDCGEIVKTYIIEGAESEWYSRIQSVLGERGVSYYKTANISTLAALFSMGLGIGKPEDLALAGLLHDIGIAELPAEIQILDPEQMNAEQLEIYKKHPEFSVNLIKKRKLIVPEIVSKAILQHHELYNGSGYPSGLFGDRICKEAQIIALADKFDYLTRVREGRPLMTPAQAVDYLRGLQVNDPSRIHYEPELLKKLLTLFPGMRSASEPSPSNPA